MKHPTASKENIFKAAVSFSDPSWKCHGFSYVLFINQGLCALHWEFKKFGHLFK